ncbi:hypothetical protein MT996_01550 [Ornithobacterium rhinotracheale]|uniref:hypothetical protein n=1 Tax=Ornithobacterium rhinotracheale TaxID=28251 RepID=UPI00129CC34F|nr:hypothetical protein [Ornithobacterium rhinotracheale]UOH78169.1 hypothetical protein MT996_01550 [Ornithobacterium rhinotracheale]
MTKKQKNQERKKLMKELEQLTMYYKEISLRSEKVARYYDEQIERIVEALKELGH